MIRDLDVKPRRFVKGCIELPKLGILYPFRHVLCHPFSVDSLVAAQGLDRKFVKIKPGEIDSDKWYEEALASIVEILLQVHYVAGFGKSRYNKRQMVISHSYLMKCINEAS